MLSKLSMALLLLALSSMAGCSSAPIPAPPVSAVDRVNAALASCHLDGNGLNCP